MDSSVLETREFWDLFPYLYETYEPLIWVAVGGYSLILNYAAYLLFKFDKDRAIKRVWRIPEGTLLSCAFFGGSFGAKVAQRRFRHKTRKEPFRSTLNSICVLHVLLAVALTIWGLGYVPAIVAALH